ncbi:hypothetical protein FHX44_112797 [Pseudonocardia hierapolitana]|uniref:Uncharacterized protein n=1 Tax=Pseudonocardia hierapolitana TaxID=1128676 RepID=A0A561SPV7_9PSEU|nr:hypothetical protein FHX44_112797 [Pseudonocardia hierapolitana]
MSPWLLDCLLLSVRHKRTHWVSDIGERMVPGIEYYCLVHLVAMHVACKCIVEGKGIVDLIPAILTESGELLSSRS